MPKLDQCHDQIVHALQKDGWTVNDMPFTVAVVDRHPLYIDIYAEQHRQGEDRAVVVVEIKCFLDPRSELSELYTAIGQYLVYRSLLKTRGLPHDLYLAVPTFAYYGVIQQIAKIVITESKIKMIVIDIEREEVELWLD